MSAEHTEKAVRSEEEKKALNDRLETIGWGVFVIMLGAAALVPDETMPKGAWSVAVGLIMLGLNAARLYFKIKPSGFTVFLGVVALASGMGDLLGVELPILPILIIVVGLNIIRNVFRQQPKKEE